MAKKPLVILGSARKSGDTAKLVSTLFDDGDVLQADLLDYTILPYRYDGRYAKDDGFMQIVELLLAHRQIIFATPVYWYAMSGLMKNFFDRLTDIVTFKKEIGRKLKGKQVFLIVAGTDNFLPAGFTEPFRLTSVYFGMEFIDTFYCKTDEIDVDSTAKESFLASISNT